MQSTLEHLVTGRLAADAIIGLAAVVLGLLLALLGVAVALRRQGGRLASLARGEGGQSLETILVSYLNKIDAVTARTDALESRAGAIERHAANCLDRYYLVRYDAFENIGGLQSFSLALLSAAGAGMVVSCVSSRNSQHVYAKAVENGRPLQDLSEEEQRALNGVLKADRSGTESR